MFGATNPVIRGGKKTTVHIQQAVNINRFWIIQSKFHKTGTEKDVSGYPIYNGSMIQAVRFDVPECHM